jgi:perosamine synthetase
MKSNKLALHGGPKLIKKKFKKYISIDKKDIDAAIKVLKKGTLSDFLGEKSPKFYGGYHVQKFERYLEKYFKAKHAITTNSWTSGLIAAVGAIGTEPGDEIIVTTWTMCASATAILHWNAIPIFADIEKETFNIDPKSIEKNITNKTVAIIAVDIFGHPANMKIINQIAKKNNLKVITDNAQSIGTFSGNKYSGTHGDIGGFSLNCHKHINTGEGGILITNNDEYAKRLRHIRNHAEAVVSSNINNFTPNMIGYNFRLGEVESAIGIEQIKKLKKKVKRRQQIALKLTKALNKLPGIQTPKIKKNCTHAFYIYALLIDKKITKVTKKKIYNALVAEGLDNILDEYFTLHLLPMYQNKLAYGSKGFPWSANFTRKNISYKKGICANAEKLNKENLILLELCVHEYSEKEVDLVINCFRKVWNNLKNL